MKGIFDFLFCDFFMMLVYILLFHVQDKRIYHIRKLKLSLYLIKDHAVKVDQNGGITPRVFSLDTRCRWMFSFGSLSLYLREVASLSVVLGGSHSRSEHYGEEKSPVGNRTMIPRQTSPYPVLYTDWAIPAEKYNNHITCKIWLDFLQLIFYFKNLSSPLA